MKLFFKFIIFILFSSFYVFSSLTADEYKEVYNIEVGKLDIGSLLWSVSLDKNNYKISITLKDKGFLSGVYEFEGDYTAHGFIINDNFIPQNYNQTWLTKKKRRDVKIIFENGSLVKLKLSPKEIERPRVEYVGINNHSDPLSSFLNILMNKKESKTIDGRRVYSMYVSNKKTDGNIETKKILIKNYVNIWADHKRTDLEYIEISRTLNEKFFTMPSIIKIKFKGIIFKLSKT